MPDTTDYLTARDFVAKASWEGGIMEALDYGLRADGDRGLDPNDQDPLVQDLRAAWLALTAKWDGMQEEIKGVEAIFERIEQIEGDHG